MKNDKNRDSFNGFLQNRKLQEEFVNSTDRAAAIIGAAAIDILLEKLIKKFLINDDSVESLISSDNINAPLSTLSSKIKAAFCLGLISKAEYEDLQIIRQIRNIFAHHLTDCDFNQQRIKSLIDNFIFIKETNIKHPSPHFIPFRMRFTETIYFIDTILTNRIDKTNHLPKRSNVIFG